MSGSTATVSEVDSEDGHPRKQRRVHWSFLLVPAAVAAFLGTWQVGRRQWKVEQIRQRSKGLKGAPVSVFKMEERLPEYQRVECEGQLQHERSILVGPRPRSVMGGTMSGYVLITPLHNKEWGSSILVNRGWVPSTWKTDPQLRARCQPSGKVLVEGVTRVSEPRSSFVPDNNPGKGEWYWVDVPALAQAAGLPPETQLVEVIDMDAEASHARSSAPTSMEVLAMRTRSHSAQQEQYPLPRGLDDLMNFSVMPHDHRNYALTWFALSGATALLAVRAARAR